MTKTIQNGKKFIIKRIEELPKFYYSQSLFNF